MSACAWAVLLEFATVSLPAQCSSSTHSTLQLSMEAEAAQITGSSSATSVPAATKPWLQLQTGECPSHSTSSCCTRSGTNKTGKGCDLGLHPSGAAEAFTGSTSFLCECGGGEWVGGGGRAHTQGEWSLIGPKQPGFYPITWGADPAPDRMVTATEQRGNPTSYPTQALHPPMPATLPVKGKTASTPWRKMWLVSILKPALSPKIPHTVYTVMLPYKNAL